MRRHWVVLLMVLICAGLAGCYTMFSHPSVGMETAVHGEGRRCSDCHTGADYYANGYPYYYDSYWRSPRWWSYYCSPWWWYDWDNDYENGGGGTQLPVGRSQYWDSRERPVERPVVLPGGTSGSGGGRSTPAATDDGESTRLKSDDKKSDSSTEVNYWNRGTRPPRPPAKPEEKPKTEEKKSEEKKTKERK